MPPVEKQVEPPRATARVLVVDDESAIVTLLVDVLRNAGYDAVGATDPVAVAEAPPADIDVLLTDYKMPRLGGLELFGRLRARYPNLVGVLSTGYGNLPLVRQAMQTGFSSILLKPCSLERVPAAVERALRQRRLREENERLAATLDVLTASTALSEAKSRHDAARLTTRLAVERVAAGRAAVLLTANHDGLLGPPVTDHDGVAPGWVAGAAGKRIAEVLDGGLIELGSRTRVALPLRCGEATEGLLAVERVGRPFAALELELLSLLADQAAVALANLSQLEARWLDEKLVLVGNMAGAICERVRAPLKAIERSLAEAEAGENEYTAMIRGESHRLELMCAELSDFVAGIGGLRLVDCSLRDMLQTLAARTRVAGVTGLHVVVDAPDDCVLRLDERKLSRAVQNLAKNAMEAMPNGGELRFRLDLAPEHVVIEVSDSGCGMTAEVQAQVFEPFYTFGKPKGTGLGGAVVQNAVAAHQGRIEIDSEPGVGTAIRIILPFNSRLEPAEQTSTADPVAA